MALDAQTILAWLRRLAALDTKVFDDVRNNPAATIPAVAVAGASVFLSGLGGWLWWTLTQDYGDSGDAFVKSAIVGSLIGVGLWGLVWIGVVYVMLTQVFRERAFLEQLMRVMGLAMSPLSLTLLMVVPGISLGIGVAALALTFGLTNIAIQRATTADAARVLVANAAGFAVWAAVLSLLVTADNPLAPGVFLYNAPADAIGDPGRLPGQLVP